MVLGRDCRACFVGRLVWPCQSLVGTAAGRRRDRLAFDAGILREMPGAIGDIDLPVPG